MNTKETLNSASTKNVDQLLNRAKKRKTTDNGTLKSNNPVIINHSNLVPLPALHRQIKLPDCGVKAVEGYKDVGNDSQKAEACRESVIEEAAVGQADHDDVWEDIDHEDDSEDEFDGEHQSYLPSTGTLKAQKNAQEKTNITIDLVDKEPQNTREKGRHVKSYTKEDRLRAQLVHRSHLLCLLGRGILYDTAANDSLVQATLYSMLPTELATTIGDGVNGVHEQTQIEALQSIVEWFQHNFTLGSSSSNYSDSSTQVDPKIRERYEDEIDTALNRAKGVEGTVQRLLDVVDTKCGNAEELCTIFASTLRVMGCLVRTVRVLEPSSLKPGDAARQQTRAMQMLKNKSTFKPSNNKKGRKAISPLGEVTKNLLAGTESQRQAALKQQIADSMGLQDASALEITDGGETIVIDPTKVKKRRKKNASFPLPSQNIIVPKNRPEDEDNNKKEHHQQTFQPETTKKRKSEEEFERQLEMAITGTAYTTNSTNAVGNGKDSDNQDDDRNNKGTAEKSRGGIKSKRKSVSGALLVLGKSSSSQSSSSMAAQVGKFWVEVFCGDHGTGRWLHTCPLSGWINRPNDVEGLAPRGNAPLAYVVAFSGEGGAKDVTKRYVSSFMNAEKHREGEWWNDTLRPLRSKEGFLYANAKNNDNASVGEHHHERQQQQQTNKTVQNADTRKKEAEHVMARMKVAAAREDKELDQRVAVERRSLPKTIEEFKNHETFILLRHIGKYQALKPGSKAMGVHRGEAYYLREDVGEVHTVDRWRREGREVLQSELNCPAKKIKKRGSGKKTPVQGQMVGVSSQRYDDDGDTDADIQPNNNTTAIEGEKAEELSNFYGIWQTKVWIPPTAINGKIPKNERGNVEVPPYASALPTGTVHIRLPGVAQLCRKLGIDYAPALVGFDIRGGRSVPSIDGVVVCIEHEDAVRAAHDEETVRKAEQAKQKRLAEAEKAWRELLRALLTRVRLSSARNTEEEAAQTLQNDQKNNRKGRKRQRGKGDGLNDQSNEKGALLENFKDEASRKNFGEETMPVVDAMVEEI